MPDHVHLALTPMSDAEGPFSLMDIMQAIKSTSAHRINKLLNRKGKVWLDESYDRVLRNEENVQQKVEYMMLNPCERAWFVTRSSIGGCGANKTESRQHDCYVDTGVLARVGSDEAKQAEDARLHIEVSATLADESCRTTKLLHLAPDWCASRSVRCTTAPRLTRFLMKASSATSGLSPTDTPS
jgi:hypothetical protein